jgi:poly(A) polymerase
VAQEMRMGKLLRWIRQPGFDELLQLHYMDAMAGSMNLEHYHFVKHALDTVPPEHRHPERLVTGSDILIRFNEKPGPHFKTILEALETEQLEGRIATKDEAFEFVGSMLKEKV